MYYSHYIITGAPKHYSTKYGILTEWPCFLEGELVGKIEHRTERNSYEKPYQSLLLRESESWYSVDAVGWHDTFAAAKAALILPARERLQAWRERKRKKVSPQYLPEFDREFYPTPSEVAGRLFAGVDWARVETILEPSAGKGDLLEYAITRNKKQFRRDGRYYGRDLNDIDCVEIDANLRAILEGKGFRVVHDDFLTYYPKKKYDLVLMNPPFSEGDKHLLHALELCERGGQIACVLNAETIRNPYSITRKLLAKELRKRGATIRFYNSAFAHAARHASVDVALVNVEIPADDMDTSIWDELRAAQDVELEELNQEEMAPSSPVERLIREYNLLCEAGMSLIRKYNGVVPHISRSKESDSYPLISLSFAGDSHSGKCGTREVNHFLRSARVRYWHELFDLPMVRDMMTSDMRSQYNEAVSDMRDYEFSMFNIEQVLKKIKGQLVTGVEAAILKCFDKLSAEHAYHKDIHNDNIHYYSGWKTNKAHRVNSKCIIPTYGCFARGYTWDKYNRMKETYKGLDAHSCFGVLDDLEKALDFLDMGETTQVDLSWRLQQAAKNGESRNIHCKYFDVTFFKKGTCHIKFHDEKIVDRLNIYVGRQRAWLPPSYGKVKYSDLDEESRRVVDEFQGQGKYETVMMNPMDYIVETKVPMLAA